MDASSNPPLSGCAPLFSALNISSRAACVPCAHRNVYETNEWAINHPGNAMFSAELNPIKAFARRGETTLQFPANHMMSRFGGALSSFALLGKLGDVVSFQNLPASVKNPDVASVFDALVVGGASESCGSPGEVANQPLAGHHFHHDDADRVEGWVPETYFTLAKYRGHAAQIHLHLALHAADQLRQRVAHALLQIFVMSHFGLDFNWNTVSWHLVPCPCGLPLMLRFAGRPSRPSRRSFGSPILVGMRGSNPPCCGYYCSWSVTHTGYSIALLMPRVRVPRRKTSTCAMPSLIAGPFSWRSHILP
jgi:hypothetical protein